LSTAKQLRAWKILSAVLVIPCATFALIYLQAELSLPSSSEVSKVEATVVSEDTARIWGLVARPELRLKVSGRNETAFSVLLTLSGDDVSDAVQVVFSPDHPERAFIVGDYPYWPYSVGFVVGPIMLFLAARFFEARYQRLAEATVREKET